MLVSTPAAARKFRLPQISAILAGLFFVAIASFTILRPVVVLPRMTPAPRFALVDQHNGWLLDSDLRGQIVIYNFTYTNCTGTCPQTSQIFRTLQDRLAADPTLPPVTLVTISFDAQHDSPATLQAYAERWGADPRRWRFATGTAEELKTLIGGGFQTYYSANPDGTYTFDPLFAMVDANGILRAKYRTATPSIDIFLRDIRIITDEARNSQGAERYLYEAAHLFVCYPR